MPLYEFECPEHGIMELYFHRPNAVEEIYCPICEDEIEDGYTHHGGTIGTETFVEPNIATRVWSVPTMRPDKYWSGVMVQGQYVTSTKEANKYIGDLEPATRENREYVAKKKEQRKKEWEEKRQKGLAEFLNQELAGVDDKTFAPSKTDTVETYKELNDRMNNY